MVFHDTAVLPVSSPADSFFEEVSDFHPVSPMLEMGAYEALWLRPKTTFKRLADSFAKDDSVRPSDLVDHDTAENTADEAYSHLHNLGVNCFGIRIHGAPDYPMQLRDARHPLELFYFQGEWELYQSPSIAVIGSRNASTLGLRRASRIARELVQEGYTVASGLAKGIDTAALQSALKNNGRVIAVIGTPLGVYYPKENQKLQTAIAGNHLLLTQVPILRYAQQDYRKNKLFFPERNATMSALTKATIIVEAGDASGTLIQAREALWQGRKLFILDSCFQNDNVSWPAKYLEKGAIRVKSADDIWRNMD